MSRISLPQVNQTHFHSFQIFHNCRERGCTKLTTKRSVPTKDACRNYSSTNPSLTPGIFTLLCRHEICCGFQVMESHESPRHPFELFLCRPPKMIIYYNGCKLHQYVLNREPVHFKNTIFLVDRFYWRGHMGCSSDYSLDGYTSLDVASINSQVNKQAHARLQRIKGHIKPDNFVSCTTLSWIAK